MIVKIYKSLMSSVFCFFKQKTEDFFCCEVKKWLLWQKKTIIYAKVYLKFLFLHVK